jgi:DNA-binding PadR family transcriptional regulator
MTDTPPRSNKIVFFLTVGQIDALRWHLDSPKKTEHPTSRMLYNLEKTGLIKPTSEDRYYNTTYQLTDAGKALLRFLHIYQGRRGRPPG